MLLGFANPTPTNLHIIDVQPNNDFIGWLKILMRDQIS